MQLSTRAAVFVVLFFSFPFAAQSGCFSPSVTPEVDRQALVVRLEPEPVIPIKKTRFHLGCGVSGEVHQRRAWLRYEYRPVWAKERIGFQPHLSIKHSRSFNTGGQTVEPWTEYAAGASDAWGLGEWGLRVGTGFSVTPALERTAWVRHLGLHRRFGQHWQLTFAGRNEDVWAENVSYRNAEVKLTARYAAPSVWRGWRQVTLASEAIHNPETDATTFKFGGRIEF